mgnify:CR=1 FL=1|tara:strand:- start:201 stop:1139 length:939 start_codon:yes stop_codon:yes gene_type:complete
MIDPVSIGLAGVDLVTSGINAVRGIQDRKRIEGELNAMGDSPNYTLSGDYDRMVNMALNAPQTGVAAAERGYGDQAAAAAAFGSRGLGNLGAASRQQVDTLNRLEASRMSNIQNALGTRAGADQSVMNANVAQDISEYTAERDRLLQEKAAAQEAINAGISGFTNLGGAALSGTASALFTDKGFGAGFEAFSNPEVGGAGAMTPEQIRAALGLAQGGNTNSYLSPGEEDHDTNEFLIARMVKTKDGGVRLKAEATSTGKELHQKTKDGELEVLNSDQQGSIGDGYKDYKKTGRVSRLIKAVRDVFELPQFNR